MLLLALSRVGELHPGFEGGIGASKTSVYHVTEGRIGPDGQAVNRYLNWRNFTDQSYTTPDASSTTPYIWVATIFDLNGNMQPLQSGNVNSTISPFSSFRTYTGSGLFLSYDVEQGPLESFISK